MGPFHDPCTSHSKAVQAKIQEEKEMKKNAKTVKKRPSAASSLSTPPTKLKKKGSDEAMTTPEKLAEPAKHVVNRKPAGKEPNHAKCMNVCMWVRYNYKIKCSCVPSSTYVRDTHDRDCYQFTCDGYIDACVWGRTYDHMNLKHSVSFPNVDMN